MDKKKTIVLLKRVTRELAKSNNASLPRGTRKVLQNVKETLEEMIETDDPELRETNRSKILQLVIKILPFLLDPKVLKKISDLF